MRNRFIYRKVCNIEKILKKMDKRMDKIEHKVIALSATVAMIVTVLGWFFGR